MPLDRSRLKFSFTLVELGMRVARSITVKSCPHPSPQGQSECLSFMEKLFVRVRDIRSDRIPSISYFQERV